jgi:hypothetical protein
VATPEPRAAATGQRRDRWGQFRGPTAATLARAGRVYAAHEDEPLERIARRLHVGRKTLFRWRAHPSFVAAYDAAVRARGDTGT